MTRLYRIFKNFLQHLFHGGEDQIAFGGKERISEEEAARRQEEIERRER
jgi:hypothetical protein